VVRLSVEGRGVVGGLDMAGVESPRASGLDCDATGSGVMFVGAELIMSVIKLGTVAGVTFSMRVKDGRSNTVVEPLTSGDSGTGMLQADSISLWE
jgi:hypothetical protein